MSLSTEVYLCKNTKLFPGSEDNYIFASEAARQTFFKSKSSGALHLTALSYQREDRIMRVQLPLDVVELCDYLMFCNVSYSSKWYYAFITGSRYINDEVTEIKFDIDPVQTWLPDCTIGTQFIERETTDSDAFGRHCLDEGFGSGDMYMYSQESVNNGLKAWAYLGFAVKRFPFPTPITCDGNGTQGGTIDKANSFMLTSAGADVDIAVAPVGRSLSNNCYQSYIYVLIPRDYLTGSAGLLGAFLDLYCAGIVNYTDPVTSDVYPRLSVDDIVSVFACPSAALDPTLASLVSAHPGRPLVLAAAGTLSVDGRSTYTNGAYVASRDIIVGSSAGSATGIYAAINTSATSAMFDGYTPVNKKCLLYPFVEYKLTDHNGGNIDKLRPERCGTLSGYSNQLLITGRAFFNNTTVSRHAYIAGYDKAESEDLHIELPDVPHLSINESTLNSWYALNGSYNQTKANMSAISSIASAAGSLASGNIMGAAGAVMSYEQTRLSQAQSAAAVSQRSPQSVGSPSGNTFLSILSADAAYFQRFCSHREAVRAADVFFTKYGYKVSYQAVPNLFSRTRFNYIKTNGLNITAGEIPTAARAALVSLFSNGLRLWHGDYLGDYSTTNTIA